MSFKRFNKYLVLKQEDIARYLPAGQNPFIDWEALFWDSVERVEKGRISDGKKPHSYVVVNEDEPYAEDVWMLIEAGKSLKELGYRKLPEQERK